jgi:hypothetical protein
VLGYPAPGGGRRGIGVDEHGQAPGVDDEHPRRGGELNGQAGGRQREPVGVHEAYERSRAQPGEWVSGRLHRGRAFDEHETLPAGAALIGEPGTGRQDRLAPGQLKQGP